MNRPDLVCCVLVRCNPGFVPTFLSPLDFSGGVQLEGGHVRSSPGRRAAVCKMQNHLLPVRHHLSLQSGSARLPPSHWWPLLMPRLQLHTEVSLFEVNFKLSSPVWSPLIQYSEKSIEIQMCLFEICTNLIQLKSRYKCTATPWVNPCLLPLYSLQLQIHTGWAVSHDDCREIAIWAVWRMGLNCIWDSGGKTRKEER